TTNKLPTFSQAFWLLARTKIEYFGSGSCMKNVQNDMNVVLRNRNAIFISPFVAHIQQMSLFSLVAL
ncbi:MAG: hypothetical protein DRI56_00325, partial [Chloroflexota bacterium]